MYIYIYINYIYFCGKIVGKILCIHDWGERRTFLKTKPAKKN